MIKLKVTSKGQITLKKEVLDHLDIRPGDEVEVDLEPKGRVSILAATGKQPIEALFGMVRNEHGIHVSIEEIQDAISEAWAGRR